MHTNALAVSFIVWYALQPDEVQKEVLYRLRNKAKELNCPVNFDALIAHVLLDFDAGFLAKFSLN